MATRGQLRGKVLLIPNVLLISTAFWGDSLLLDAVNSGQFGSNRLRLWVANLIQEYSSKIVRGSDGRMLDTALIHEMD